MVLASISRICATVTFPALPCTFLHFPPNFLVLHLHKHLNSKNPDAGFIPRIQQNLLEGLEKGHLDGNLVGLTQFGLWKDLSRLFSVGRPLFGNNNFVDQQ